MGILAFLRLQRKKKSPLPEWLEHRAYRLNRLHRLSLDEARRQLLECHGLPAPEARSGEEGGR